LVVAPQLNQATIGAAYEDRDMSAFVEADPSRRDSRCQRAACGGSREHRFPLWAG